MESEILQMRFIKLRQRNSIFSTVSKKLFYKFCYTYSTSKYFSNDDKLRELINDRYKFFDILISKIMIKREDPWLFAVYQPIAEELYEDGEVEAIEEFFGRMNLAGENYIKRNFFINHIKYLMLCDEKIIREILTKKHDGKIDIAFYVPTLFALHQDELLAKFCVALNLDAKKYINDVSEIVRSQSYPRRISKLKGLLNIL
jgi:hypothetical protein